MNEKIHTQALPWEGTVNGEEIAGRRCRREMMTLGFGMFAFMLSIQLSSVGLVLLLRQFWPSLLSSGWVMLGINALCIYIIGFLVLYAIVRRVPTWDRADRPVQKITLGRLLSLFTVSYSAGILSNIIAQVINQLIKLATGKWNVNPLEDMMDQSYPLPAMFLYMVIAAPIVEELIFRGVLLNRLRKYGDLFAMLSSGLLFGLFHGNLTQAIFAFACGVALAYVKLHGGRIWSCIVIHALTNLFGFSAFALVRDLNMDMGVEMGVEESIRLLALLLPFLLVVITVIICGIVFGVKLLLNPGLQRSALPLRGRRLWRMFLLNPGSILFLILTAVLFVLAILAG